MIAGARDAWEHAGELFVVGIADVRPARDESAAVLDLQPAGVILFGRNVRDESQVRRLTAHVRDLIDRPLILIDQEGGRVDRLRTLRGWSPSLRELTAAGRSAV